MKRITPLKLTCVGAFVAALGVGCASSGTAQYDADSGRGVSVAASADTGTDMNLDSHESRGASATMDTGTGYSTVVVDDQPITEGEERVTVSALSFNPETRANWVNRFPFHDPNWRLSVIETYTFAPEDDVDLPEFRTTMRAGETYTEAAGGVGYQTGGRRIIQHSPNPR